MNKTELITAIAEKAEITKKDAEKTLKAFEEVVTEELVNGNDIKMIGFGTFSITERAAREGINPQTKESINIPASKVPKFKAGTNLKSAVNI